MLAAVLRACPNTRGVLFDSPEVVAGAAALLDRVGVADRCEVVGGDFFAAVPAGGDAYLLCQIVHDWRDPQAVHILRNCRAAMRESGRLLVVERALATDCRESLSVLHADMGMLVHVGGLERTDAEYRTLFAEAGFRLTNIVPVGDRFHYSVFEGVPA
jgi:hypothetical protein